MIHGFQMNISQGIAVLHRYGLAHCVIKPENILLNKDEDTSRMYCVITDFGLTQVITEKIALVEVFQISNANGQTVEYAAPEVFKRFHNRGHMNFEPDYPVICPDRRCFFIRCHYATFDLSSKGYLAKVILEKGLRVSG
jgi:serine/threonine protein kinase